MGKKTGNPRGRPPGSRNKRTLQSEAQASRAAAAILAAKPKSFKGDAHALLMLVYKDPDQPMDMRIDAAGKAIRFEKPALAAVDMKSEATVEHVIRDEPLSPEDRDAQWLADHGAKPH